MRGFQVGLVVGLLTLFGVAACTAEGNDPGVASVKGDPTTSASSGKSQGEITPMAAAVAYGECMRENGIKELPDPKPADDGGISFGLDDSGIDTEARRYKAADTECRPIMEVVVGPGSAHYELEYKQLLEHSECMRDNGIPDYPDPQKTDQGFMISMPAEGSSKEQIKVAEKACEDYQPSMSESELKEYDS